MEGVVSGCGGHRLMRCISLTVVLLQQQSVATKAKTIFVNRYAQSRGCTFDEINQTILIEQLQIGCTKHPDFEHHRNLQYDKVTRNLYYDEECDARCEKCNITTGHSELPDVCFPMENQTHFIAGSAAVYADSVPCYGSPFASAPRDKIYSIEYYGRSNCSVATGHHARMRLWNYQTDVLTNETACASDSGISGTYYKLSLTSNHIQGWLDCDNSDCDNCAVVGLDLNTSTCNGIESNKGFSSIQFQTFKDFPVCSWTNPTLPPPNDGSGDDDTRAWTAMVVGGTLGGAMVVWIIGAAIFCRKKKHSTPPFDPLKNPDNLSARYGTDIEG
eukprot:m.66362 g.66362  ORF g.66362 m.66362 type:complete len:330 (+) comp23678_c0_seq2:190-1179(+)